MRKELLPKLVTRRETQNLLGYLCSASLRRLEKTGRLTPIRPNSRRVLYRLAEVNKVLTEDGQ